MSDRFVVFLDANVLAKPATRSVILFASEASGYAVTWSEYAEQEADRHIGIGRTPVSTVRTKAGMELSIDGADPERFAETSWKDRQILADAQASGALFLMTEDVDDFAETDLASVGVSAVNPDLFLSVQTSAAGYLQALDIMAAAMHNPMRTSPELHTRLGRQHPLLTRQHAALFDVVPLPAANNPPAVLYRGTACLACLAEGKRLTVGICDDCRAERGH